jgi:YidC/Oxa1 family membrane protein insertase
MFPVTYKQEKSMQEMNKVAPLEKEIREKYKGDKDKMAEELTKMYSEHRINPAGGCLTLLIQLPLIFAIFAIVKQPLTYIMQVPHEQLQTYTQEYLNKETVTDKEIKAYEIEIADKKDLINMDFLGLDFGAKPSDVFAKENRANPLILIVPLLSLALAIYQNKQNQNNSNMTDEQKEQQKGMTAMMPFLSGYISYIMPLALGIYWLIGNILQMLTQWLVNGLINKKKIMLQEGGK